jgi:hypothetical protein
MPRQAAQWKLIAAVLFLATAFSPMSVRAEGLRVLSDLEYVSSHTESTNKPTGLETDIESAWFSQLYHIDLQKQVYSYLDLRAGGLFELNDRKTTTDVSGTPIRFRTKNDDRAIRYFAELNLNNPLHRAGAAYRKSEIKTDTTNSGTTTLFREQYTGLLSWRPAGLPGIDMNYDRSHIYNDPETRDSLTDFLTLRSHYDYESLELDYGYTRNDSEEQVADSGILTQIHNGGIRYSTRFFDSRLSLTAASRMNYRTLRPSGTGDFRVPTPAPGGYFFLLNDSEDPTKNDPDQFTTVDAENPLTLVNIGRNAPPDDLVSIGLDFGSQTEVDTIYVTPKEDSHDLTLASPEDIRVADQENPFVWQVFCSNDQERWEVNTVSGSGSTYSEVDNRFEISFIPNAECPEPRYIKVSTLPNPEIRGEILISGLQALTTFSAGEVSEISDFDQNYNFGLRWLATEKTTTSYDLYYKVVTREPFDTKRTNFTNSLSLQHIFNPIFVGSTRLLRSVTTESEKHDTVHHSFVASLRGDYLDTFGQVLTYSGTHHDDREGSAFTNSLFLRNRADLHPDWSLNLDLGYSWGYPAAGGTTTSKLIRVATNLAPNRSMHFRCDYSVIWNTETGGPSTRNQAGNLQIFWVPLETLSLSAALTFNDRHSGGDKGKPRLSQDFSVNWAPFPDGSLSFFVGYSRFEERAARESWMISPGASWQIARGILLTLNYNTGRVDSTTERRDVETFTGNLRIFY